MLMAGGLCSVDSAFYSSAEEERPNPAPKITSLPLHPWEPLMGAPKPAGRAKEASVSIFSSAAASQRICRGS